MNVQGVFLAGISAKLSDGLQERQTFDIADGAPDFNDNHIHTLVDAMRMEDLISSVICGMTCTVPPR
jgi:hypothetical protein